MRCLPKACASQRGLSLLELLMVVGIIAILSGAVIYKLDDMRVYTLTNVALVEMSHIKKAVLQFEKDNGRRPSMTLSPVDLEEFFIRPADLNPWNIIHGRGWRGPYLDKPASVGYVDMGDGLQTDGSGSPIGDNYLTDIPAVADPFKHPPVLANDSSSNAHWYFNWITQGIPGTTDGETEANDERGRPYALFDMDNSNKARIVSFGPNGRYEHGGGDDLVLCIFRSGC